MAKKDRTGEVIQTKYGPAKIIQYNSNKDITVLFDSYGIKKHVDYGWLVKGKVLPPGAKKGLKKDHVGDIYPDIEGNPAECIAYNNYRDCTIRFFDGTVKEHVTFDAFKSGRVSPHKNRAETIRIRRRNEVVGLENTMNCGLKAVITEYYSNQDIIIRFEDGSEKHTSMDSFKNGTVANPNINISSYRQTTQAAACISPSRNKTLPPSTQKKVRKDHVGDIYPDIEGNPAECIAYHGYKDCTIRFSDGAVKTHVHFDIFKSGKASSHKNDNIPKICIRDKYAVGKVFHTTRCGNCTVVEYKDSKNITVKFEDGTIVNTVSSALGQGMVDNPNHMRSEYIGAKSTTYNGIPFTVTDVVKTKRKTDHHVQWIVTVTFIDGTKAETKEALSRVMQGKICHPSFRGFGKNRQNPYEVNDKKWWNSHTFLDYELYGRAFETKTSVYYYCRKKDSLEQTLDVLTPKEMIERSRPQEQTV